MSARLVIVVEVPDDHDPLLVDPHEVAEEVVHYAAEGQRANGDPVVTFVSAEWEA